MEKSDPEEAGNVIGAQIFGGEEGRAPGIPYDNFVRMQKESQEESRVFLQSSPSRLDLYLPLQYSLVCLRTQQRAMASPQRLSKGSVRNTSLDESAFAASGVTFSSNSVQYLAEPSDDGSDNVELSGLELAVLVNHLHSGTVEQRRSAAREVRHMTRIGSRIEIAESGCIKPLVKLLSCDDAKTVENAAAAIYNLSIEEANKAALVDSGVIDPIVHVVTHGTPPAQEAAAATVASLALVNENKIVFGVLGAIAPLVRLLVKGHAQARKDALAALFQLSIYRGNKPKLVKAAIVPHLLAIIENGPPQMIDKALQVLGQVATTAEGRESISQSDGICLVVDMLEDSSERGKEEAAAILLLLCEHSNDDLAAALHSAPIPSLNRISNYGTARARRKANELLQIFRDYVRQNR